MTILGDSTVLSRFHATLVDENWSLSDPDPKLIIPEPDLAKLNNLVTLSLKKTKLVVCYFYATVKVKKKEKTRPL